MAAIDYRRARTLSEALDLKATLPDSKYIAGGTDLVVRMKSGRQWPRALVSLRSIAELRGVSSNGVLRVGAAMPLADILRCGALGERYPALAQAIASMGSVQIRNAGTIGGNLANASPCADTAPPLLCFDASAVIAGPDGERSVALDRFFTVPGSTELRRDELLVRIEVPAAQAVRSVFLKRTRVQMDLGIASVAVALSLAEDGRALSSVRVAAGAVAPTPLRLRGVETLLEGSRPSPDLLRAASDRARDEVRPISDVRSSADYRRHIVGVYVRRALCTLAEGFR